MKIVINISNGGFMLSALAMQMYAKLKFGKALHMYRVKFKNCNPFVEELSTVEEAIKDGRDEFLIYTLNEAIGTDSVTWGLVNDFAFARNDPVLVEVVETLGKKAETHLSELKVVEIPDDVKWAISCGEYGAETIEEVHRSWS